MGKWVEKNYELELLRKIKVIFADVQQKLGDDSSSSVTFENFVEGFDEKDKFTRRLFEFLVKETTGRHRLNGRVMRSLRVSAPFVAEHGIVDLRPNSRRRRVVHSNPWVQTVNNVENPMDLYPRALVRDAISRDISESIAMAATEASRNSDENSSNEDRTEEHDRRIRTQAVTYIAPPTGSGSMNTEQRNSQDSAESTQGRWSLLDDALLHSSIQPPGHSRR
eukprot:Clim_evm83s243 gene=Clim_evmTU83s243